MYFTAICEREIAATYIYSCTDGGGTCVLAEVKPRHSVAVDRYFTRRALFKKENRTRTFVASSKKLFKAFYLYSSFTKEAREVKDTPLTGTSHA